MSNTIDLMAVLPRLLPKAIAWAEGEAERVTSSNQVLNEAVLKAARAVGVTRPELIRIEVADTLPMPADPELQAAALATGLLGPGMVGLTLGYAVFLKRGGGENPSTVVHEFRHVHQYEVAGSIAAFLPIYLGEIARVGYDNCSFERDARQFG